ncbi:MarR family transcriptional regulator [Pseudonocardia sp. DSM 110487]|uniref:MarR family winged helix-turn-helix transcriptional regulator n=1 Tax=Pseudonocardia sp. DSM 110487 TaxID=2865833 RepID=UPI001C6A325E|nr:MarR family transcriptional regulator [Pseudonocardia sp. DSM 110487]QYN37133.1 MarR family transcriptional regulator [Pseudonocardia sp. DSM 110487]
MSGPRSAPALVEQVMAVAMAIVQELKGAVRELGLSESVAHLVWVLDPDAEPVPLRQVAEQLRCDPSNVTLLSDQLEKKGLAERRPHPADGRVRTLVLTPEGVATRRRLLELVQLRSPLAALDGEQQRQLQSLLSAAMAARKG